MLSIKEYYGNPKRKETLTIKELDGDFVIYDSTNKQYHILNKTASIIWNLCDGEHTIENIEKILSKKFMVSQSELSKDVRQIFQDFLSKEMIIMLEKSGKRQEEIL